MSIQELSNQLAIDARDLNALKREARGNTAASNKAVARQFEALFLQTVLKSMRDATPHEGMFDSEQTRFYESMHDQQLTQVLATKGGGLGLAAMIEKQLNQMSGGGGGGGSSGSTAVVPEGLPPAPSALPLAANPAARHLPAMIAAPLPPPNPFAPDKGGAARRQGDASSVPSAEARSFVDRVWPHALEVSRQTGIPAHFMVAQAALETGWGKSEPHLPDGRPSHNLFGIKADRNWSGAIANATTTEVVNGVSQRQTAAFRAYDSYAAAFRDYARLLTTSPRYGQVLGTQDAAGFARGLQQAGYATDPMYAAKLVRIIEGQTLRSSLQQG